MGVEAVRTVARQFQLATGVECAVVSLPHGGGSPLCAACADCAHSVHAAHVKRAARMDGRTIYLCGRSLTFFAAALVASGRPIGGLVAGPVRMIDAEDLLPHERLSVGETSRDAAPRLSPQRVQSLTELLYMSACFATGVTPDRFGESKAALERESRINEHIQALKLRDRIDLPAYPIETESAFLEAIGAGAVEEAQRHLNQLLGHVFFAGGADMHILRNRAQELVVLLSRVAMSRGADPQEMLGWNYQLLDDLEAQQNVNHLAAWLSKIVRRFSDTVLLAGNPGHSAPLRRAIALVRARSSHGITLSEAAQAARLSPSYLSRLFTAEVGVTFSEFVTATRIEEAQRLLRSGSLSLSQVAAQVGFSSQSYFTRVFKAAVGVTPGDYRRKSTSEMLTPLRSKRRC